MTGSVREPARDIPVLDEVDVLVAGGGVAGCAAAHAAATAGARTMLLERNGCLGGVATASLMANIGNLFLTAAGDRVIQGFGGALIDRLVAVGAASRQWASREVPGCVIDSERLKVELIDLLHEAGVTILTHALGARPILEGSTVRGAFVESKSGRQAVAAAAVIDATGEADLAAAAGAETGFQRGTASTLFKLDAVDLDAFVDFLQEDPDGFPANRDFVKDLDTFTRNWRERGILFFPHGGGSAWRFMREEIDSGRFRKEIGPARSLHALGMYALRGTGNIVINSNFYAVEDLDVRNLSRFELHAQTMCYYVADFLQRRVPGFARSRVAHVGVDLGVRVSRFIRGRATVTGAMTSDAPGPMRFDDVIGVRPVMEPAREFVKPYALDVPFGVTVPRGCRGLLVASGKSVSTEPAGILRSMADCMMLGQAAGIAAALGTAAKDDAADVPIRKVQAELLRQGAWLGPAERLRELGLD